jgi:hypothetical protein
MSNTIVIEKKEDKDMICNICRRVVHGRGRHHKEKYHSIKVSLKWKKKEKNPLSEEYLVVQRERKKSVLQLITERMMKAFGGDEKGMVDWWLLLISVGLLALLAWMIMQLITFDNEVYQMYR